MTQRVQNPTVALDDRKFTSVFIPCKPADWLVSGLVSASYLCESMTTIHGRESDMWSLFSTGRAAPASSTTCSPGWSNMPTTWRTWWRSERRPTWRRRGKLRTYSIKSYLSESLSLKKSELKSAPQYAEACFYFIFVRNEIPVLISVSRSPPIPVP